MLDQLDGIIDRYEFLSAQINDADVIADQKQWQQYMKEHSDLTPVVEKYKAYKANEETIQESLEMLKESDPEIVELAKEELSAAREELKNNEAELKKLLLPKDPNDDKNVIV